jgi:hypothetical protein
VTLIAGISFSGPVALGVGDAAGGEADGVAPGAAGGLAFAGGASCAVA